MAVDRDFVEDFARRYAEAWCSRDPASVAAFYVPGGTIAINGGEPAEITEVARGFITAFPDIEVFAHEIVVKDETVEFHWTFTGTSEETGNWVRIHGYEEWTFGEDGLVAKSEGHYDQGEYDRQLEHGAPAR
jgi:nuclear transport factor 2 (NTF2) superfamily protein